MKTALLAIRLMIAIAVANYGVVATATAHNHDDNGFHQVHVMTFDGSDHTHDHDAPAPERITLDVDQGAPTSDHSETGFHSHSTPQFGPSDGTLSLAFSLISDRLSLPNPQGLVPLHRESPPFKPPRVIL